MISRKFLALLMKVDLDPMNSDIVGVDKGYHRDDEWSSPFRRMT